MTHLIMRLWVGNDQTHTDAHTYPSFCNIQMRIGRFALYLMTVKALFKDYLIDNLELKNPHILLN